MEAVAVPVAAQVFSLGEHIPIAAPIEERQFMPALERGFREMPPDKLCSADDQYLQSVFSW